MPTEYIEMRDPGDENDMHLCPLCDGSCVVETDTTCPVCDGVGRIPASKTQQPTESAKGYRERIGIQ